MLKNFLTRLRLLVFSLAQIHKLQSDFHALEELASTPEMIERIKTNSTDPVTDMWHIINITKRLDAAEKGIDKVDERNSLSK